MRAAHSSGDESDTDGYETDTTFNMDDALDDDDDDGDEALATFSSSKTIHESADVVRIAPPCHRGGQGHARGLGAGTTTERQMAGRLGRLIRK